MPEISKCRSCGAAIIWVQSSVSRNLLPLDAVPVVAGNIAIKDGLGVVLTGDMYEEVIDGPRYVNHFATCPQAASWRKKRGGT